MVWQPDWQLMTQTQYVYDPGATHIHHESWGWCSSVMLRLLLQQSALAKPAEHCTQTSIPLIRHRQP